MKVKTVEITKADAKIELAKQETSAAVLTLVCLLLMLFGLFVPVVPSIFSMAITCVGVVGVLLGLTVLMVITFAKSKIKALNILFYGFTKFILKEAKDA